MNVKDLRLALAGLPDEAHVFVNDETSYREAADLSVRVSETHPSRQKAVVIIINDWIKGEG